MSVQPQSMRLFFNRNSSQGGLPSDYSGDAPGSKWLLRKKGYQLSSCVPLVDTGVPELGTKRGVATNGVVEAVVSTLVRSGRQKFDVDLSKKSSDGTQYIRVGSPDLAAILNDVYVYDVGALSFNSLANEFVLVVRRRAGEAGQQAGFNWYLLRINADTYEIVPGNDVSGILHKITRSASLVTYGLFFDAFNPGQMGGIVVKNGAAYIMGQIGGIAGIGVTLNVTALTAGVFTYQYRASDAAGISVSNHNFNAGIGLIGHAFESVSQASSRIHVWDPTLATQVSFDTPATYWTGAALNVLQGLSDLRYLMTHNGQKYWVRTQQTRQSSNNLTQYWPTIYTETGAVAKVLWTGPITFNRKLFVGPNGTFFAIRHINATLYQVTKFTFDPATLTLVQNSQITYTYPAGSGVLNTQYAPNDAVQRFDQGYILDVNKNIAGKVQLQDPTTGAYIPQSTVAVSGTIGNVTGLVALNDLALHAAYPAMYIPEEGSDLEPVACTALVSKFTGGEFDGAVPDKNFLVNISKNEETSGRARGQCEVASMVDIELMNTSCLLSGPGRILNFQTMDQE